MGIGIIIQARTGSTRLLNKVLLPFYNRKNILELLLEKLISNFENIPIIIATTINESDNAICDIVNKYSKVKIFRGSESNVLSRFIDAGNKFHITKIIRICSDNPFLDVESLRYLIELFQKEDYDYLSFKINEKPSILTHYGFWAEAVKLETLIKIQKVTTENIFNEHVTNFIYTNPNLFNIKFISYDKKIDNRLRMTLDTKEDFDLLSEIYSKLITDKQKTNISIEEINDFLLKNYTYLERMQSQIQRNKK